MSQISHPIGLRLQLSTFWQVTWDLFNKETQAITLFLVKWLQGFCWNNHIYFIEYQLVQITRLRIIFLLFFWGAYRRRKRLKKIIIRNEIYSTYRSRLRKKNRKRFRLKFVGHLRSRYKEVKMMKIWLKYKTRLIKRSIFLASFVRRTLKKKFVKFSTLRNWRRYYKQNKNRRKRNSKSYIIRRISTLRLKFFLEEYLTKLFKKQSLCLLTNLKEIFQSSQLLVSQHRAFHFAVKRLGGKVHGLKWSLSQLFIISAIICRPIVVHQWLYYSIMRVKKHNLINSHHTFLRLLTVLCEGLVYFIGILKGYRTVINGKVGGASRTKKYLSYAGKEVTQHAFQFKFGYHFQQIPTYAGVLGCRLWYVYY